MLRRRRPEDGEEEIAAIVPVAARDMTAQDVEPTIMAAPVAPVATRNQAAPISASDYDRTIAAMVAEKPSEENPFLTHAKRLRRARVLLAERTVQDAPTALSTPLGETAAAQPIDRSQMVYRFGKDRAPSGFLKPRTR